MKISPAYSCVSGRFFVPLRPMDIELTNENLEYVSFVAKKFCHLYGKDCEEIVVVNALDIFQHRVDLIECVSNYALYKTTSEIQTTIEKYGYNTDGFWLLLLFLRDYTDSCFGTFPVFDKLSTGKNIDKMLAMLENPLSCHMTISNGKDSAYIHAADIHEHLKELLLAMKQNTSIGSQCLCIGTKTNTVLWHKIKFFMDMLDYFLTSYSEKVSKRKDWIFIAQALYLVGYFTDEKYLYGYERIARPKKDIDGKVTISEETTPLKGLGKYLTDNTKHLKDTANRQKSRYCYNIFLD